MLRSNGWLYFVVMYVKCLLLGGFLCGISTVFGILRLSCSIVQ